MADEIPILYLFIYGRIKERANSNFIHTCDLLETIGRTLHFVPKPFRYPVIRELERYELIKRVNKLRYAVTGGPADLKLNKYVSPLW